MDQERDKVIQMVFYRFVGAILVRNGTEGEDSGLLEILTVALEHVLQVGLYLLEDDVWVILRELLESEGTRFPKS